MVKIKEWRQGLGITQKALADAAGLDIRWVQKLEAGEIDIQNVTEAYPLKIQDHLHLHILFLFSHPFYQYYQLALFSFSFIIGRKQYIIICTKRSAP